MNLNQLLSPESTQITSDVVIAHDEQGNPKVGFKIVGPDSKQYRTEQERQRKIGMKRRVHAGKKDPLKTEEGQAEFDRLTQENITAVAVAVTVGWFGFTDDAGAPLAFDATKLPMLFANHVSLRDKIADAVYQEDAFLPKPATV